MLVRSELIRPLLTIKVGPGVTEGRTCRRSLPSAVKMAVQDHPKSRFSSSVLSLHTFVKHTKSCYSILEMLWIRCIQNFYGSIFFSHLHSFESPYLYVMNFSSKLKRVYQFKIKE